MGCVKFSEWCIMQAFMQISPFVRCKFWFISKLSGKIGTIKRFMTEFEMAWRQKCDEVSTFITYNICSLFIDANFLCRPFTLNRFEFILSAFHVRATFHLFNFFFAGKDGNSCYVQLMNVWKSIIQMLAGGWRAARSYVRFQHGLSYSYWHQSKTTNRLNCLS